MVFQEFLSLLREEERLLLHGMDRPGVANITEKKEQVLEAMCRYEQQVMAVMHQLAGPKNRGVAWRLVEEVATISSIIGQYDFP